MITVLKKNQIIVHIIGKNGPIINVNNYSELFEYNLLYLFIFLLTFTLLDKECINKVNHHLV